MDIGSFFTLQAMMPNGSSNSDKGGAALGASSFEDGANFIDLILSYMKELGEAKDEQIKQEKEDMRLAKMLADNPEVAEQLEKLSINDASDLADILALNQQAFDDIMKPVEVRQTISTGTVETPEGPKNITDILFIDTTQNHRPIVNKIKAIVDKVQKAAEKNPSQLIAANLTPEQLTDLQDYLTALENGETPDVQPDAGLIVGLIKLLPPQARPDLIITGQSLIIATRPVEVAGKKNPNVANDLSAHLSALNTPENAAVTTTATAASNAQGSAPTTQSDAQTQSTPSLISGEDASESVASFEKAMDKAVLTTDEKSHNTGGEQKTHERTPLPASNAASHTPPAPALNANDMLVALIDPDSPLMTQFGLTQTVSANPANLANLTNPVTQGYTAGMSAPAVQTLNNALQRLAQNGKDAQITLRLDPPELGRINAKLQFEKSNALKTTLTVEKPETYAMLQRDTHSLERALQDIGLDVSDGINLELAEQGFNFDQGGNERGGGHDAGGTGAGSTTEAPEEIIQSTMMWHVDPETGHTRYNILA
ncbi:MAG: flagellar hook-length control protein FliK [Alphaproteobacteria bacterium]|nr:flagellar hook-length control protein FliK [Alphaproteobacteria bacterium]